MKNLKDYFSFTRRERNGITVLVTLILLVVGATLFLPRLTHFRKSDFISDNHRLDSFRNSLIPIRSVPSGNEYSWEEYEVQEPVRLNPEKFNPNTVTGQRLSAMGLPDQIIRNILKYRASGGYFREKKDFKKIYNLTPDLYARLEPYIQIERNYNEVIDVSIENRPEDAYAFIDINREDSVNLQRIYGIGPVLAARIVKYRNLLGGFFNKEQLLEVYGIDTTLFLSFESKITIDTTCIRKLNLNHADLKTLNQYPYLNLWEAKAIMTYRELSGSFNDINEIERNGLVSHETFLKIKPYLAL